MPGFDVTLRQVNRDYRIAHDQTITALGGIDLNVPAGGTAAITGPSGSGKSTLLHIVGAMDRPTQGEVTVGGQDVMRLSRRDLAGYRRTIGFVFQSFHLLPALTVLDNVIAPLLPYRTPFDKHQRGRELLESVGLADRAGTVPARLSGGEQQRVAIARALVGEPGLLLADEPTGNLDSGTGAEIMQLLVDLRRERGMTLMVATHDPVVASRCDRIIKLADGHIVDDLALPEDEGGDDALDRIGRLAPGG